MSRRSYNAASLLLPLLALGLFNIPAGCAASGNPALQDAVVSLRHGDYKDAEQKLRAELKLHPGDAEALSLLGVALGGQKRFAEADEVHRRAVAIAPSSPEILDNYANNLLAVGDDKAAEKAFLKAVSLNPAERNANLQLTQMALNRRDGRGALVYLDHLKDDPDLALMRLLALDFAGDSVQARTLFERLSAATEADGNLSAEDGWALARAGQFDQAETFLAHALAADPSNFRILYSLGVTASQAGHNERARAVLGTAVRQQPQNVDALYALAFVYTTLKQPVPAIPLLADAGRLAPQRADVQKLLAIATGNINAQVDSIAAWERYMKLAPGDDSARRERGFEKSQVGMFDEAISDLEWFVARHPDDAVGFYELGVVQGAKDPTQGLSNLDRAIELNPDFVAARSARGKVLSVQGKPEAALPDLEFAVAQPSVQASEWAAALDRLGHVYLTLDRVADAVPVLRKAVELAPDDSTTLLHLANALAEAGQTDESDVLMARFRRMRSGGMAPPKRGLMDYLSLSPEKRHEDYRSRLIAILRDRPDDKTTQLLYLELLLGDNQMAEATADARSFAAMRPGANWLADAGHALLEAKQYSVATEVLEQGAATDSSASLDPNLAASLNLDLAVAALHTGSASATLAAERLRQLDRMPESGRGDDYYLVRAQLLDAANKPDDAVTAMDQALNAAPKRPDLYWQAAVFLVGYHRAPEALALLDRAAQILPDEASIWITRATVLELAGKSDDAQRLLNDVQRRWPEVPAVWVTRGMILATHQHFDEACRDLETAVALGAHSPEVWYALADSTLRSVPVRIDAAEAAISKALKLAPDDPNARAVAARIAAQKSDPAAEAHGETTVSMTVFLNRPPRDW